MSDRENEHTARDGGRRRDGEHRGRNRDSRGPPRTRRRGSENRDGRRDRPGRRANDRSARGHPPREGTAPPGRRPGDRRGGDPPGGPGSGDRDSGNDDSGRFDFGRREFLLGGAGVATLAAGGWWFFGRGYDGAKGTVAELYGALDSNDWATVDRLIHEDSTITRQIDEREGVDSYEEFLSEFGGLERQENTDYDVRGLHEMDHEPDPDAGTIPSFEPGEHDVAEFKWILAIVETDASRWEGLSEDEDPVQVRDSTVRVALNGNGEWKLW